MPARLKRAAMPYCWGYGGLGELGNSEDDNKNYPVLVVDGENSTTALADIVQVGAGDSFSCALKSDGGVHCFGAEYHGRLGNNQTGDVKNYPVSVLDSAGASASAITAISKISVGQYHTCALKDDGEMLCWGRGTHGRLGNDATSDKPHAVTVVIGDNQTAPLDLDAPTFSSYTCNSLPPAPLALRTNSRTRYRTITQPYRARRGLVEGFSMMEPCW